MHTSHGTGDCGIPIQSRSPCPRPIFTSSQFMHHTQHLDQSPVAHPGKHEPRNELRLFLALPRLHTTIPVSDWLTKPSFPGHGDNWAKRPRLPSPAAQLPLESDRVFASVDLASSYVPIITSSKATPGKKPMYPIDFSCHAGLELDVLDVPT